MATGGATARDPPTTIPLTGLSVATTAARTCSAWATPQSRSPTPGEPDPYIEQKSQRFLEGLDCDAIDREAAIAEWQAKNDVHRELVMLIHWDGFIIVEAAALLGLNASTARDATPAPESP